LYSGVPAVSHERRVLLCLLQSTVQSASRNDTNGKLERTEEKSVNCEKLINQSII
jgi:hypothetical protein